ncbi:MAG: hypothetical protein LZF86_220052 [Nitrospira sp.]|nr:MAG: hypothetical protein LZF86_220052 [Nitrospira sp.]
MDPVGMYKCFVRGVITPFDDYIQLVLAVLKSQNLSILCCHEIGAYSISFNETDTRHLQNSCIAIIVVITIDSR